MLLEPVLMWFILKCFYAFFCFFILWISKFPAIVHHIVEDHTIVMSYHIIEDHKIEYHIMKITLLKIILLNIIFLKIILLKIILLAPLLKCFFSSVANETLLPRQDFPRISAALFSQQMLWRKVQSKGFWSFKRKNGHYTAHRAVVRSVSSY